MSQAWRRSVGVGAIALTLVIGGGASAQASAPDREQQRAFAALRGAPARSVSSSVERLIDSKGGRATGVDGDNVYRVDAPTGGSWALLPGKNGVCVVFEDREGVSACASTADAKTGALRALLIKPAGKDPVGGTGEQVGVLPDAAAAARATLSSGTTLAVRVGDAGQYVVRSTNLSRPVGLRLRDSAGRLLKERTSGALEHPGGPSVASAAAVGQFCTTPVHVCTFYGSEWRGPYGLTGVSAASWDGNWICGNAVNPDGSWAGASACSNTTTAAYHPYNGSSRTAWAGPGVAGVPVYGSAAWGY